MNLSQKSIKREAVKKVLTDKCPKGSEAIVCMIEKYVNLIWLKEKFANS